jgi:hypothetical protein
MNRETAILDEGRVVLQIQQREVLAVTTLFEMPPGEEYGTTISGLVFIPRGLGRGAGWPYVDTADPQWPYPSLVAGEKRRCVVFLVSGMLKR